MEETSPMEEINSPSILDLQEHERRSAKRAKSVKHEIEENAKCIKNKIGKLSKHMKGHKMSTTTIPDVNIFQRDGLGAMMPAMLGTGGVGAGAGAGLGAGLLGGVLGGALLGGGGILGGREGGREFVTPTQLTAGLAGVTDALQNTTVIQTLGDIKASIPLAEGQVQLALSGAVAALSGQASLNQAATILGQANLKDAITTYGVANLSATKDAQYALNTSIVANTDRILAAINGNEISNLNRQLTVAESRGLEDRFNARQAATEVTVNQSVNQIQAQSQTQQQQQQITGLVCAVNGLVASHQNLQQGIVNLGTMTGNSQTAANTRVN